MRTNTQRILALAGMTLAAGAAVGMTSTAAFAADASSTQVAPGPHPGGPGDHHDGDHHDGQGNGWGQDNNWGHGDNWGHGNSWNQNVTRTVGYYRNARSCTIVGLVGEHRGQWDTFRCIPVNHGHTWALVATSHHGDWNHGGGWH